ncbi:TetR/AcrR family transcriptional regulator [Solibacillus sp. FSL K6-1523]|uniref:TetR/AcrR family transcriptional regulator n=1 Tax=Solibacillus sp. FSL K6-1523 TaxID=2921471 RepID=UPI0030F50702
MTNKTRERILHAASTLMEARGYNQVPVKEIAELAGVSEMTIFRHFETKIGILEALIQQQSYIPYFEQFFKSSITFDVKKDLIEIAHQYLLYMNKNKVIFLISIQERGNLPELSGLITEANTNQLQSLLAAYFDQLIEKGLLKPFQSESQAIIFLTTMFGYFATTVISTNHFLKNQQTMFINNYVETFLYGVTM